MSITSAFIIGILSIYLILLPTIVLMLRTLRSLRPVKEEQSRTAEHIAKIRELLDMNDAESSAFPVIHNLNSIEEVPMSDEMRKELYESMLVEALKEDTPEAYKLASVLRDALGEIK